MKPFVILSSELVLKSPFCPIEKQCVVLPTGEITDWWINKCNDAVIIIPINTSGNFLYQKAYKHGSGKIIFEFPTGIIDEGENPLIAAKRELEEETGLIADRYEFLGSTYANPTGAQMQYHFFCALDCVNTGTRNLEPAEQIECFWAADIDGLSKVFFCSDHCTSSASLAALSFYMWQQ
jgi:ADP-ribose pyrophosphatase